MDRRNRNSKWVKLGVNGGNGGDLCVRVSG